MVKWEDVCKPMRNSGLGIGNIENKNLAFVGKWLWRFAIERCNLWQSFIFYKYGSDLNGRDCNPVEYSRTSLIWKYIIRIFHQILSPNPLC